MIACGEYSSFRIKGIEFLPQNLFFYPLIFATRCRRPLIFQTINFVRSNSIRLKYERFPPSGWKDNLIICYEGGVTLQQDSRVWCDEFRESWVWWWSRGTPTFSQVYSFSTTISLIILSLQKEKMDFFCFQNKKLE